jgi:hypothetical protein
MKAIKDEYVLKIESTTTPEKYIEDVIDPFKLTLRNRKINVQIFCKDSTKRSG